MSIVELSEDDPALDLIRNLERIRQAQAGDETEFVSEYDALAALLNEGKIEGLLGKLLEMTSVLLDPKLTEQKEMEVCFYVLFGLFKKLSAAEMSKMVDSFVEKISGDKENNVAQRLKVLVILYNLMENEVAIRFALFCKLLRYATATKQFDLMVPHLKHIAGWLVEWRADLNQEREIYHLLYELMAQEGKSKEAHTHLLKYLGTFENAPTSELDSVKALACKALVEVVCLPDVYTLEDYLDMKTSKHLKNDGEYGSLWTLCTIFSSGSLAEFDAFVKANSGFFSKFSISQEDCLRKIRMLSVCSVGEGNQEVPYSTIATALGMDESEVERWVIKCISAKLIDAKMDQLNRKVIFTRVSQRLFTREQWQGLKEKLEAWKTNVKGLLQVVAKARQEHAMLDRPLGA
jgi:translation initiation factor 3 subunit M